MPEGGLSDCMEDGVEFTLVLGANQRGARTEVRERPSLLDATRKRALSGAVSAK